MGFDLERFVMAQDHVYEGVIRELRAGRKTSHWIWFIFPQLTALGRSETARFYGITSLEEARAYLEHPVLGPRLLECAEIVAQSKATSIDEYFGWPDRLKVRSSVTLFMRADPGERVFRAVIDRWYNGAPDGETDALLGQQGRQA